MSYKVVRKVENGEFLEVGTFDDFSEAKQILESYKEHFPGDYLIQDSVSDGQADD